MDFDKSRAEQWTSTSLVRLVPYSHFFRIQRKEVQFGNRRCLTQESGQQADIGTKAITCASSLIICPSLANMQLQLICDATRNVSMVSYLQFTSISSSDARLIVVVTRASGQDSEMSLKVVHVEWLVRSKMRADSTSL